MVIREDTAAAAWWRVGAGWEEGDGGTSPALSAPERSSPICHPAQYLLGWQS